LENRSAKTVNNVLTVLNVLLKKAVEWDVIDRLPCTIRLLPIAKPSASFHDFDQYEPLVTIATTDRLAYLAVLLGGEAGLRCGEVMALEWRDIDLQKRQLCIERSVWKGHATVANGGRIRYVPLTNRLAQALRASRHLKGPRALCPRRQSADTTFGPRTRPACGAACESAARRRARAATFCSHLSMRGAPVRAIQELAGHQAIGTTQRYMQLSPAAIDGAICLLDHRGTDSRFGDIVETGRPNVETEQKRGIWLRGRATR
jgi:integrase